MWCEGLDYEDWYEKHDYDEETMNYLYGYCNDWVNENYQIGDKCVAITEWRDEEDCLCLMHSCLLRNDMYVDIRGETNDFNQVIETFDWSEYEEEIYDDLESFNERMVELGVRH